MTQDLYRKEALDHVTQRLYGEVILESPPSTWVVTVILMVVFGLILALLFLASVEVNGAQQPLIQWLLSRS